MNNAIVTHLGARPDKLGFYPMMVVGGIYNKWIPSWKVGGIPRVNTRFRLSVENERDGRTRLSRPNPQAQTRTTGKTKMSLFI